MYNYEVVFKGAFYMKNNNLKGSLILMLTAFLWGIGFVAQNKAAENIPPFTVNCLRSFISAVFLYGLWLIINRKQPIRVFPKNKTERKTVLTAGLLCGFLLAVSVNFQQFGIAFYPKGAAVEAHAGFITALYVIIVPFFSLLIKKKVPAAVWIAAAVALVGFYLLCLSDGLDGIYLGDLLVLGCAVSFSLHIISVDRFVEPVGGVRLSMLQFVVCGILSGILAICFEIPQLSIEKLIAAAAPVIYLGVVSSGMGYTLQIIGQRYAEPAVASIVMSLESVFAALGGWLISGNSLSASEFSGCGLVFAAIIIAQLPSFFKKSSKL